MYITEAKRKMIEKTKATVYNDKGEKFVVLMTNGRIVHIYKHIEEKKYFNGEEIITIHTEEMGTSIRKTLGVSRKQFMELMENIVETEGEM